MTSQNKKPMLINCSTYGYFYPDQKTFRCTHGAWESQIVLIDDSTCRVRELGGVSNYKFLDALPEGYGDDYEP